MTDGEIARRIGKLFDLRPAAIVKRFGLKNPIFEATASYGHFGNRPYTRTEKVWENGAEVEREIEFFGWEKLDAVERIRKEFGLYGCVRRKIGMSGADVPIFVRKGHTNRAPLCVCPTNLKSKRTAYAVKLPLINRT